MADVILSERAKADLDLIDRFGIENFGSKTASDYMHGFHDVFERLSRFPESGPVVARIKPTIRRLSYRSHHVFYESDGDTVTIIRILHHAMKASRHLRQ